MCGIAGIYEFKQKSIAPDIIKKMGSVLTHRGPNDEGIVMLSAGENCMAFGHRRLSILDLSLCGHQPMSNEDDTVWITYNGEIYNYLELKDELLSKGHKFKSSTDTEVIIHLYEEEGRNAILKLNGIFAFAIWDSNNNKLLIVRDRFGIKPVYYTFNEERLIFASEIKAILEVESVKRDLNLEALFEHFTFQNTFRDKTFFKDIFLLPQGHFIECRNGKMLCEEYWDIQYQENNKPEDENYYALKLRELFERAVKRQLCSDVPVGTYLSGGMDTGSISAVARRNISKLHTFTCGFDTSTVSEEEVLFDERKESKNLADFLSTIHHEMVLSPGDMEKVLAKVVWHLEEPRVGISYQIYYVAQLISNFVTVVLSGVGGDEFFAGYPWRHNPILKCDEKSFDETYYKLWIRFFDDEEKKKFFSERVNAQLKSLSSWDSFKEITNKCKAKDPLNRAMYFDAKTFLNGLLIVEDKLSMAHSIESRVPFLDNDLIDFTLTIPSELKFKQANIKYILKKAMDGLLPNETLTRRKQGFTPPDKSWYKSNSLNYIKDLILSKKAVERDYFKKDYLQKILDDHITGKKNNRFLIWSLMCFEWWNRIFIDRETIE